MISRIETINRFLASVRSLETDVWANETDAAEYYTTQYVYSVRDVFSKAKEFCIKAGLIGVRKNKLRLTRAGQVYLGLGINKKQEFLLEPNVKQKIFLNRNVFLRGATLDLVKELLYAFRRGTNGHLQLPKEELMVLKDENLLGLLLQSGILIDQGRVIELASQYAKKFETFLPGALMVITPEAFELAKAEQKAFSQAAEKYALNYERTRLENLAALEQAKNIDYTAAKNVAAGYDISSFNNKDSNHHDRFIEVKAGKSNKIRFFLSRNEFEIAKKLKTRYWIYYICIKNKKPNKIYLFRDPVKNVIKNSKFNIRIDTYEISEI